MPKLLKLDEDDSLAADLLVGVAAISQFLGEKAFPPSRVYYLAKMGHLPVRKIGRKITARRSKLQEFLS